MTANARAVVVKMEKRGGHIDIAWAEKKWGAEVIRELLSEGAEAREGRLYFPTENPDDPHQWFPYAYGARDRCLSCGYTRNPSDRFEAARISHTECCYG
jgi:hypothetical protein